MLLTSSFDGKSLQVAELLVKKGFKEAYAIKGGIRGKDGWQEIQETLLPPSVHVFAKTDNRKTKEQLETNDAQVNWKTTTNGNNPSVTSVSSSKTEAVGGNGSTESTQPTSQANLKQQKMLSPYLNYPDLKPPSSPAPSQPVS
ncbi:protein TIC 62, chloroplastic-like isoform X2 [Papaver somniferum]|uniref:protein TIC 62, chloroplastic-like isoform X2 n=1 Tax=Papaver somniferum TaxID=3469 RepID=UPI000E702E8B|nr:protein TIC 62, chloroplastic-like isoform X2 [Papaver somniferum]